MKNKNLKKCPSGKQVNKVSRWANLKDINLKSFIQLWNRRVFLWIFRKKVSASLTVEAAFVVPIFLLALCTVMGILDCYRIQSTVKTSIHQSAMELGMYASVNPQDTTGTNILNSALCVSYAQDQLPELEENVSVSMVGSHYKNNTVTLIAVIKYTFPIQLFPIQPLKMVNVSEVYSWVGASNNQEDEINSIAYQMVYVTENESVYHTSASCSHIDIKIYEAKKKKVDSKYEACKKCCQGQTLDKNSVTYYTKTGDCYHAKKDCSSLKRIIRMVDVSQIKGLPMCERCKKRENT